MFKLVPGLFHSEMKRRSGFYKEHPEAGECPSDIVRSILFIFVSKSKKKNNLNTLAVYVIANLIFLYIPPRNSNLFFSLSLCITGGDKTEQSLRERRHFFHVDDQISLSLEYLATAPHHNNAAHINSHVIKPLKVNNGQQEKQKQGTTDEKVTVEGKEGIKKEDETEEKEVNGVKVSYLLCTCIFLPLLTSIN